MPNSSTVLAGGQVFASPYFGKLLYDKDSTAKYPKLHVGRLI